MHLTPVTTHTGWLSAVGIKPHQIDCGVNARRYVKALDAKKRVFVNCSSSCATNIGSADPGWAVFSFGPFRDDSSICKAAFVAGVIGHGGGVATLVFAGRAQLTKKKS